MELCWNVGSNVSIWFHSQVLCFVSCCERMATNFIFSSEIFGIAGIVTCKVVLGLTVANKAWRSNSNWLSLHFKTEIWIGPVNDPLTNISLLCMHTCFLLACHGWVRLGSLWVTTQIERLLEDVWIRFNYHFLAISYDVVRSKHIKFLSLFYNEYWTSNWTRVCLRCSCHISFIDLLDPVVNIHDKGSFSCFVSEHETISISDLPVSRVSPWNLFMVLLIVSKSLVEW